MTAKKRDQTHHDLVLQYLPGLIPNTVPEIICELGDPYDAKPGLGGMTAYPPMAMAAVCIVFEAECITYCKIVGIPKNNHAIAAKIHGNSTRAAGRRTGQGIPICATCYNIELVARSHVKDGRLTQDQIATLAA